MDSWITPELIQLKRDAIESIYHHRFTVYRKQPVFNEETGFMEEKEVPIIEDAPCRISTQIVDPTDDLPRDYIQKVNLITAPEWDIPIGCRIHVKYYNGIEEDYMQVSASRDYSDHQTLIMRQYREGKAKYA